MCFGAQARAALMQEMNAAALLGDHSNVVRLVGVCEVEEESKLLVVLERADGRCARRVFALAAGTV